MSNYKKFRQDDLDKSKVLALNLGVTQNDIDKIEHWFDQLLAEHRKADHSHTEEKLEKEFDKVYSEVESQSYKFILAKLLNYNNIFQTGFLKSTQIGRLCYLLYGKLIPKFLKVIKPKYSVSEFLALSEYLKSNFYVSPNGELLENILKIEKANKIYYRATQEQRLKLVKNLLNIIKEKGFHHDIICFKKILNFVSAEDESVIELIKKFQVDNHQGCYTVLNRTLNLPIDENPFVDLDFKKGLIQFLDTSRGAYPKANWLSKLRTIKSEIGEDRLIQIANEILSLEEYEKYYFDPTFYWSDDVVKRFMKGAKWMCNGTL